jgi:N-acetylglutamate synthase-like GNAT family acetyltransferase
MNITRCSWSDIENEPGLVEILAEGTTEAGLLEGKACKELYRALEQNKVLKVIKCEKEGNLVGLAIIILFTSLHYSVMLAQLDTIYVLKEYRSSGAGLKLLKEAEKIAEEAKVPVLFYNARINSEIETILLYKDDYELTHTIFCKRFKYDVAENAA